jgi:hypothetical protein
MGMTTFELNGPSKEMTVDTGDKSCAKITNTAAIFLQWHNRLGHVSPKKIQIMARQGILPAKLANCPIPICTSCIYGKTMQQQWRTKPSTNKNTKANKLLKLGKCTSLNQLISMTPSLISQLQGIPTSMCYHCAMVFVNQANNLKFFYLQQGTMATEMIKAKQAYDNYAASQGANIPHYHANNGIFADNQFRQAITDSQQTLSFCGVNAHWQKHMAKK